METIISSAILAAPPTLVALLSWRASRKAKSVGDEVLEQVTPSNGTPTAALIEQLAAELHEHRQNSEKRATALANDLRSVKDDVQYHIAVQHGRGPMEDPS